MSELSKEKDEACLTSIKDTSVKTSLAWKVVVCLLFMSLIFFVQLFGTYHGIIAIGIDLIIVVAIMLVKPRRRLLKGAFSFEPLRKRITYFYILCTLIFFELNIYFWFEVLHIEESTRDMHGFIYEWWNVSLFILSIAIITPIVEEVLFRGMIFGYLQKRYNFWLAIIVSSIIFGILHIGYPISATIVGITFVLLYKVSKSLIVPILVHIIWNLYAVIWMLYF